MVFIGGVLRWPRGGKRSVARSSPWGAAENCSDSVSDKEGVKEDSSLGAGDGGGGSGGVLRWSRAGKRSVAGRSPGEFASMCVSVFMEGPRDATD